MNSEKLQAVAFKWFDAFNNHDMEQLLSLYDDEATHYSPKLKINNPLSNGTITGKDALHAWWKEAFERLPSLQYKVKSFTANTDRIFMEYLRTVDDEQDLLVAEVLDIRENKIIASRVYHS